MTPIIPPIWLYLFEVLSSIDGLFLTIVIVSLVVFFAYGLTAFIWYAENGESIWMPKKWICILICFILHYQLLALFSSPPKKP